MLVHVIESAQASEVSDNLIERDALRELLDRLGIACRYEYAFCEQDLEDAFQNATDAAVIHVSCHANQDGLGLENGAFVKWYRLGDVAADALNGKRLVLSACRAGMRTAPGRILFKPIHAGVVIAPYQAVGWQQAKAAWNTFYARLRDGAPLPEIMADMNKESAVLYRAYVRKGNTVDVYPVPPPPPRVKRRA